MEINTNQCFNTTSVISSVVGVTPNYNPEVETAKLSDYYNPVTHKLYSEKAVEVLAKVGTCFKSRWYVTFKQAKSVGLTVKRGAHGIAIPAWNDKNYYVFNLELLANPKDDGKPITEDFFTNKKIKDTTVIAKDKRRTEEVSSELCTCKTVEQAKHTVLSKSKEFVRRDIKAKQNRLAELEKTKAEIEQALADLLLEDKKLSAVPDVLPELMDKPEAKASEVVEVVPMVEVKPEVTEAPEVEEVEAVEVYPDATNDAPMIVVDAI